MRPVVGLVLLALAGLAWIVGAASVGADGGMLLALLVLGAGFALAAWAHARDRSGPFAAGVGVAALGTAMFVAPFFGDLGGLASLGTHVFLAGVVVAAVAAAVAARGSDARTALRAGFAVCALGALLWVPGDWGGGLHWQPGNVLALFGATLVAWKL